VLAGQSGRPRRCRSRSRWLLGWKPRLKRHKPGKNLATIDYKVHRMLHLSGGEEFPHLIDKPLLCHYRIYRKNSVCAGLLIEGWNDGLMNARRIRSSAISATLFLAVGKLKLSGSVNALPFCGVAPDKIFVEHRRFCDSHLTNHCGSRRSEPWGGILQRVVSSNYRLGHVLCFPIGKMLSPVNPHVRGSTLIEAAIAAAICALFLGSLFAMNTSTMETIKMARETACASQVLQQRIEAMRIANWHQITDASWIQGNLLNTDAAGSDGLKNVSETLTLVPYGSSSTSATQLSRTNGNATIIAQNSSLLTESAVKAIWTVNFSGSPNDRASSRQTVAILAKGGVAK
jgi:hypothetical protein